MVTYSFPASLQKQQLELHIELLSRYGIRATPFAQPDKKLQDLITDSGLIIECKTDYHPSGNLAMEVCSNIIGVERRSRIPAPAYEMLAIYESLPPQQRGLLYDTDTTLLSYFKVAAGKHILLPMSVVRQDLRQHMLHYDVGIGHSDGWYSMCLLVPVDVYYGQSTMRTMYS